LSRTGRAEAADRLYRGLETSVHCGAEALADRAREALSAAGLRPLPLRYAQTDTLTPQERRAAEETAQGHPVPVVAKELHLTERGVRQLLSSAYRELGTDTAGLAEALESFPAPGRDPRGRGGRAGQAARARGGGAGQAARVPPRPVRS